MTTDRTDEVVVAALTYKRVDDIIELAPILSAELESLSRNGRVVVVDNDPDQGARAAVAALALPRVQYVHEPLPGIANARNAALDAAGSARFVAFIDDDERPETGWLSSLLATQQATGAAAVAGVVKPVAGIVDDPWIEAGRFFVRQRHQTGADQAAASTANLLVDLDQLRALGPMRFDVAFGMTGGSDTMLTRSLVKGGGRIVWCDEAVVVDHIRPERATRSWVVQRAFRNANVWSRTSVALAPGSASRFAVRCGLTLQGGARMAVGVAREAFGRLSSDLAHEARGRRTLARGTGMVVGAWGFVYNEYGTNRASRAI